MLPLLWHRFACVIFSAHGSTSTRTVCDSTRTVVLCGFQRSLHHCTSLIIAQMKIPSSYRPVARRGAMVGGGGSSSAMQKHSNGGAEGDYGVESGEEVSSQ